MTEEILVSITALEALVGEIFTAHGANSEQATSAARAVVAAEISGQSGHGLSRVESYGAQLRAGKIRGDALPKILKQVNGRLVIDAQNGFAYPALDVVARELPAMAKAQGIAAAAVLHSHHAGALGVLAMRLAEAGALALIFANTPKAMAPYGGKRALLGTNPIAFAAPRKAAEPLVIDLALSKVARGKIMAAAAKGEPIPDGWALDANGQPTTDAKAALEGTMIPIGDAKGAALALMVEVLASALTGGATSFEASSFLNDQGDAPDVGQFVIAIAPDFVNAEMFYAQIERICDEFEHEDGARLPGARAQHASALVNQKDGIALTQERLNALMAMASMRS